MTRFLKEVIIPALPEMILSMTVCALVGVLIYWVRGVHHAPFVAGAIGFAQPMLRKMVKRGKVEMIG